VCELSERFDKWSPASFGLGDAAIRDLVAKVALQTIDDIKFAQAQARRFAAASPGTSRMSGSIPCPSRSANPLRWRRWAPD